MDGRHHHHPMNVNSSSRAPPDANLPSHMAQRYPPHQRDAFFPGQRIDVSALNASVQQFIPSSSSSLAASTSTLRSSSSSSLTPSTSNPASASSSYISLPPGFDPHTVDFRAFYPYNPSEVKHRKRTTRNQLKILEETFKRETKPNASLRKTLATTLEMTPRGVQVWFQNRRAKEKSLAKKVLSNDKSRTAPSTSGSASNSNSNSNSSNSSALGSGEVSNASDGRNRNAAGRISSGDDQRHNDKDNGCGGNADRDDDLCDDHDVDLDLDRDLDDEYGDEGECEMSLIADEEGPDMTAGEAMQTGATPSPGSTTSELVKASAVASTVTLPLSSSSSSANSSPSSSTPKSLSSSPDANKRSSPLSGEQQHVKREVHSNGSTPPQRTLRHGPGNGAMTQTPTMIINDLPMSSQDMIVPSMDGVLDEDMRQGPLNNNLRRPSLPTHLSLSGLGLRPNGGGGSVSGPPSAFRLRPDIVNNCSPSIGDNSNRTSNMNGDNGGGNSNPPSARVTKSAAPSTRMYDPTATRRLSLDRLASHPYAHLALQANGAVYGPNAIGGGVSLLRRASAFAGSPQHYSPGFSSGRGLRHGYHTYGHGGYTGHGYGSAYGHDQSVTPPEFATIGEVRTPQPQAPDLPLMNGQESDLHVETHHPGFEQEDTVPRPDLAHRASLPTHTFIPTQQQLQSHLQQQHAMQSEPQLHARNQVFPSEGHSYMLPPRNFEQVASNGSLPATNFSFGSASGGTSAVDNGGGSAEVPAPDPSGSADVSENNRSSSGSGGDLAMTLAGFTFPQGSSGTATMAENEECIPPNAVVPGMAHGSNPYGAPRFGSIASEYSEYESSTYTSSSSDAMSGGGYFSPPDTSGSLSAGAGPRRGSIFEFGSGPVSAAAAYEVNDGRRSSYAGQIADMFSNLDVHNASNPDICNAGGVVSDSSRLSQRRSSIMPISQSSELAFALTNRGGNGLTSQQQQPTGGASDGPNADSEMAMRLNSDQTTFGSTDMAVQLVAPPSGSDSDVLEFRRQSLSASSSSTASSLIYPLSVSASSSSSSLSLPPHLAQIHRHERANLSEHALHRAHGVHHSQLGLHIPPEGFVCSEIEEVSGTGHYSPVSHPGASGGSGPFDLEFARGPTRGVGGSNAAQGQHHQQPQHPLSQSSVPSYAPQHPHHSGGSSGSNGDGDEFLKMSGSHEETLSLGLGGLESLSYHGGMHSMDLGHGHPTENPNFPSNYYG